MELINNTNCEAPCYVTFFIPLLLHLCEVGIFSALCSQTVSLCARDEAS